MLSGVYKVLFDVLCKVGRPFGGIPPRRITYHWLGRMAYEVPGFCPEQFAWYRDRYGSRLLLNPYYFLDRQIIAFGTYEPELQEYIRANVRPGMVCFDIGANIGTMSVHLGNRVGSQGRVYAFEPMPRVCDRLIRNIEANGLSEVVKVNQLALSDSKGTADFGVADETKPNQGMGSLVNTVNEVVTGRLVVNTITLDGFVEENGISQIDLMKIDIQGAEPKLLKGGIKTLTTLSPDLLMEVSPADLECFGTTGKALLEQVEALGYHVYELAGVKPPARIDVAALPKNYSANSVLCTKRTGW